MTRRTSRNLLRSCCCAASLVLTLPVHAQQQIGIVAALAIGSSGVVTSVGQQPAARVAAAQITYDQFIQLDPQARRERFGRLNAENKALIKRTHAERWLVRNRARLSEAQIAVAQEAIEFVTPALYRAVSTTLRQPRSAFSVATPRC